MQRKMKTANVDERGQWTLGELIEMEFGITCDPTPHTSLGAEPEKCRPGAGTPADGGMDKNMELQSTSRRIQQGETGDKASSTGNGGVA